MPLYSYKAVKYDGEVQQGEQEAADEAALVGLLQTQGLIPLKIKPARGNLWQWLVGDQKRALLTDQEIGLLTRELATLLEAGLPLDRALQTLIDLSEEEQKGRLLVSIQEEVRAGVALSVALEKQRGLFSRLYVNMVRAGEASGALQQVMVKLADYLDRIGELRESIKSALVYPLILVGVAGLSVILLLVFVVPQFAQLFADMGEQLPLATRIVIAAGDLFRDYWWAMLSSLAIFAVIIDRWLKQPDNRRRWDERVLRLPVLGDLLLKLETARFCRTMAILLENGLTLLSALNLSKEVVVNRKLAAGLGDAADDLKHGKGLAGPLTQRRLLPKMAVQMIQVGEESGQMGPMLGRVADIYDRETSASVKRMLTLLEPILIIGLGVVVAGIIMSILVAILSANELVF